MWGALLGMQWVVIYTTKKSAYYLSNDFDDTYTKIVWTKRKDKAKRFVSEDEANKCIAAMKLARNDKNMALRAAKVY